MGVGTDYTSTETTDAGSVIRVIKQLHPVEFTDSSTNADSVLWNFGDGNTSTERNPIHNYSSNGTFVVTLTAYNQFGEDSTTQTVIVSGIGVEFYEVESEEPIEEEVVEEEIVEEEVVEEEVVEEESAEVVDEPAQEVQTFTLDIPTIPEIEIPKDSEDQPVDDYGYEGDINLDATTTTEETTTQETTEEQSRLVEFIFQPFSPDGMSVRGMEIKDFALVEGDIDLLQIGTSIKITGMESKRTHYREVSFVIDDEKSKGVSIDIGLEAEDFYYQVEAEV